MLKNLVAFLLIMCMISVIPASAQVVVSEIKLDPPVLLPGDEADGILKMVASEDTSINSVVFFAPSGIKIEPAITSSIGQLKSGSTYELPFTVRANEPGKYRIDVRIGTSNGSVKQIMIVRVEDRMPELILNDTIFKLNEVNTVQFRVITPFQLSSLVVEPMFNATPRTIYVSNGEGVFTFYPTKPEALAFKIKFYNGRNYHEIIQTVRAEYRESSGLFLNVSAPPLAMVNDAVPLELGVTNLRDDTIYSVKIRLSSDAGIFSSRELDVPSLASSESKTLRVLYSPDRAGETRIELKVTYRDTVGIEYSMSKEIDIKVVNETPVVLSNLDVEKGADGVRISGDVSNVGLGNARNILLEITSGEEKKTYYLGTLTPSDFDSFEFKLTNASNAAILKITWMNDVGKKVELTYPVEIPASSVVKAESNLSIIAIVAAIAVLVIVALIWIRSR